MRAVAAHFLAAAVLIAFPVPQAAAAENPHNLGSCSACHPATPRFGIDSRKSVTFTTSADDPGLCSPCHSAAKHTHPVLVVAGAGPPGARISGYLPTGSSAAFAGKIVCTSCHFIHAADTRYGLLRGFPGSPDPRNFGSVAAFCEECHGANLASRSPHGGGAGSCAYCHAGQPRSESQVEVAPTFMERCKICHRGVRDSHFANLTPFGSARECKICHDQHAVASDSPGLLSQAYRTAIIGSVVISPHFRRGFCLFCHANTDDYALLHDDVNALCNRCHATGKIRANIHPLRKVPPTITPPKGWPLTDGALTCLTCHDQGHEDQPQRLWMLHGGPYASPREVCRNCHKRNDLESSTMHQDINEGKSCEMCHAKRPQPGVDTIKTVSFIADPDLLCLRCHDQNASDGSVHHGRVIGREIEEGHILTELPLYNGRVICGTCHNPHQREATGARLREFLTDSNFCINCHRS